MVFENKTLAVIGAGVMGNAIIQGLLRKQAMSPENIIAADPNRETLEALQGTHHIHVTSDNLEAASSANLIVLSVKPQAMEKVMQPLRGHVDRTELILSIAAGVSLHTITSGLLNSRVARAMPNTPGQIGQGVTVWTATTDVKDTQLEQAQRLLGALGKEIHVDDERFLDMATALSGTGPAYIFLFMEALIDAGVYMGFSRRVAQELVLQTMRGSVEYALNSGLHPAVLRNQVTSPGGTTASALYEMEKGRLRTIVSDAIWAAYRRAHELGEDQL